MGDVIDNYLGKYKRNAEKLTKAGADSDTIEKYLNTHGLSEGILRGDEQVDVRAMADQGAPAFVRERVGSGSHKDRLANLQAFFPDAEPFEEDNFIYTNDEGRIVLFNPKGLDWGDVAGASRDITMMAGGTLALAATAPATLASGFMAAPVVAGTGAALAGQGYDILRSLGKAPSIDTRTAAERTFSTASDVAVMGAGQAFGQLIGRGIQLSGAALKRKFSGTAQAEAPDWAATGVTPTAGALTSARSLQATERMLASTPGGQGVYQRQGERLVAQMAVEARRIAESYGVVRTTQELGGAMKTAAEGSIKRFTDRSNELYDKLYAHIKPTIRVPVSKALGFMESTVEKYADPDAVGAGPAGVTPLGKKFGGGIMALLDDTRLSLDTKGEIPFSILQRLRHDVGQKIRGGAGNLTDDITRGEYKQLYSAIIADISAAAKAVGPKADKTLQRADRYYRRNKTQNIEFLDKIIANKTDEQIANLALRGVQHGASTITRLRRNFTRDEWKTVAASTLNSLGKAAPTKQDWQGNVFDPAKFMRNWGNLAEESKKALFNGVDDKNLNALRPALDRLGKVVESVKQSAFIGDNPGMGRQFVYYQALGLVAAGGTAGWLVEPNWGGVAKGAATVFVLPRVAAKLLTSTAFVNWLGKVPKAMAKPNGITPHLGRLIALGKDTPELRNEIYEYISTVSEMMSPRTEEEESY